MKLLNNNFLHIPPTHKTTFHHPRRPSRLTVLHCVHHICLARMRTYYLYQLLDKVHK
nr:MAG TPA: hypothetical protein [Bacteriophage sp.]